jgi:hypothetical protein
LIKKDILVKLPAAIFTHIVVDPHGIDFTVGDIRSHQVPAEQTGIAYSSLFDLWPGRKKRFLRIGTRHIIKAVFALA